MISIGSQSNKIKYGIKHYILDTDEDFNKLPKINLMGCTCFVISTSKYYMMSGEQKWVEITPYGKTVSPGGGGDTPDNPNPPGTDDIIYEGGEI
jgi:hypothetical protein